MLEAAAKADVPEKPSTKLSASGKVVDETGKPVAGANVYLRAMAFLGKNQPSQENPASDILATATTDKEGLFHFKDVVAPEKEYHTILTGNFPWEIVVLAEGHALAWERPSVAKVERPLTLKLKPEAKLQGRLVDSAGKSIRNARVRVATIQPVDQAPDVPVNEPGYLNLQSSQLPLIATSDSEGRFVLRGLPKDIRAKLEISEDRCARRAVFAATTKKAPGPVVSRTFNRGIMTTQEEPVYADDFTITLKAGHRLRVRVIYEDTGKPAAGARFASLTGPTTFPGSASADSQGRFTLGALSVGEYWVAVAPPEKTDYLGYSSPVTIPENKSDFDVTVKLPPGAVVTGKVLDEETGKGISDVTIYYNPSQEAPAQEIRTFVNTAQTGPDGRFRIALPPGKGQVNVGVVTGYVPPEWSGPGQSNNRFNKAIDVKPGQPIAGIDFTLTRGLVVTLRILDANGKAVKGATCIPGSNATSDAEGKLTLSGLNPDRSHEMSVTQQERKLGNTVLISPPLKKKSALLDVKLQPMATVTGRVLDESKKPIPGASVVLYKIIQQGNYGMSSSVEQPVTTDPEGKFAIAGLIPGGKYNVQITAKQHAQVWGAQFEAQSGQTQKLADSILAKADQTIAGVVVDPRGKPLVGVQIYGWHSNTGGSIGRGQVLTDKEGRFRLTEVPKGLVRLNAQQVTSGGRPAYSSVQVQAGKEDIKLILFVSSENITGEAVIGKPAPEFPVARWVQRKETLSDQGFARKNFDGKVVLLAFLDEAKPSQRLIPQLNLLYEKLGDHGLIVVRVYEAPAEREKTEARVKHLQQSPTTAALVAPGLVAGGYSEAFQKYGVLATPTLFLIDGQGILRYGDVEPETLKARIEEFMR